MPEMPTLRTKKVTEKKLIKSADQKNKKNQFFVDNFFSKKNDVNNVYFILNFNKKQTFCTLKCFYRINNEKVMTNQSFAFNFEIKSMSITVLPKIYQILIHKQYNFTKFYISLYSQ